MDRARLDEPLDPEVGGSKTARLRLRFPEVGLQQFLEAAIDELIFGLATKTDTASSVNVSLGHDEQRHDSGPSRRHEDGDRAAHAVTHQAALAQFQGIDERDDRPSVILDPVAEVKRLVAVAVAKEVNQE
jgi:hypothetical protein